MKKKTFQNLMSKEKRSFKRNAEKYRRIGDFALADRPEIACNGEPHCRTHCAPSASEAPAETGNEKDLPSMCQIPGGIMGPCAPLGELCRNVSTTTCLTAKLAPAPPASNNVVPPSTVSPPATLALAPPASNDESKGLLKILIASNQKLESDVAELKEMMREYTHDIAEIKRILQENAARFY